MKPGSGSDTGECVHVREGGEEELKKRTVVSDTTQDSRSGFHRQMRDTRPIKRRFQRGTDMCEPAARHRPSLARHRSPPVEN